MQSVEAVNHDNTWVDQEWSADEQAEWNATFYENYAACGLVTSRGGEG